MARNITLCKKCQKRVRKPWEINHKLCYACKNGNDIIKIFMIASSSNATSDSLLHIPIITTPTPKRPRGWAYEKLTPTSNVKKERKLQLLPVIREGLQISPDTELVILTREEYDEKVAGDRRARGPHEASMTASCLLYLNHSFSDKSYRSFRSYAPEYSYKVQPLEKMKEALPVEMPIVKTTRCDKEECPRCAVVDVNLLDQLELNQHHIKKNLRLFALSDIQNLVSKLKLGAGRTFDGFVMDAPTLLYRHSVDGIKFDTKLCQVKWSRGCLNNQGQQVSRRNEILVGLYQGNENTPLLQQHFGNSRMTSCHGTVEEQEISIKKKHLRFDPTIQAIGHIIARSPETSSL